MFSTEQFPTGVSNSNRNYEVFWGDHPNPVRQCGVSNASARHYRAFEDRHAGTQAYIDTMRPRCVDPTLAKAYRRIGGAVRDALTGQRAALSFGSCLAVRCAKGSSVSFVLYWPMALRRNPHGN